ncbi:MAG: hypothetical protein IPN01_34835 [Deltaproteobacteria bacterium]|nr:hypothetical protein [Deltaproteobacteria bacterium]
MIFFLLACAAPHSEVGAVSSTASAPTQSPEELAMAPDQVVRAAAAQSFGVPPESLRVQPLYLDSLAPFYRVIKPGAKPRSDGVMPGVSYVVLDGAALSGAEGYAAVMALTDDAETLAGAWLYLHRGGAEEILGYAGDGLPRPSRGEDGQLRFVYADARGQHIDVVLNTQTNPPEATTTPRPKP